MVNTWFPFVLVLSYCMLTTVTGLIVNEYYQSGPSEQTRLITDLLATYHEGVPPTHEGPVQVRMGFTMSYFDFLNEAQQQACVHVWSSRAWVDPRLRWDPAAYNGTNSLLLDVDQIWIPDIELYNGATVLKTLKAQAIVSSNGSISYVPSFQINFICEMNLRYFPYDTQICQLKMGSWHYHSKTLNLTLSAEEPDLSHFRPVTDFDLVEVKQARNLKIYPCCKEKYIDITYDFVLKRRPHEYCAKLVVPAVLSGFLVLGTFLVPNNSYEKITYCVVLFLCITHLLTYLHDIIPTSGNSILGRFLAFALFLDFFAIVLAVVSYNLHRGPRSFLQTNTMEMDNDASGGERELKVRKPPNRKKGLLQYFDFGCFILFAIIFLVGTAVILGGRP